MDAKTNVVAKLPKPSGYLAQQGSKERPELPGKTLKLLLQGWELRKRIEALEGELAGINGRLRGDYAHGSTLVMPGVCLVSVSERETVKIDDEARLRELLGERFGDLVRQRITLAPTERLLEIAADADDPTSTALRQLLSVSSSTVVTWRPAK